MEVRLLGIIDTEYPISQESCISSFVRYKLNSFQTSKDGFLKIAPFLFPYAFLNQAKTQCSSIQSLGRDRTIMPLGKTISLGNVFRLKITNGDKRVPFKVTV